MNDFNIINTGTVDIDRIMELINYVQALDKDVMLAGNAKSLDKLKEIGFPVNKYQCMEVHKDYDDFKIFIIPIPIQKR